MKYLFPVALLASFAAAQASSACGADYIVEACLTSEKAKFTACDTNDWDCKCASYEAILTCFNNCPNDPRRSSEEGQKQIFCGYASQYPSKTQATVANTGSPSGNAAATTPATATSAGANGATGTNSGSSPSSTGAAADLAMNAGGLLIAVAGVVAAVL